MAAIEWSALIIETTIRVAPAFWPVIPNPVAFSANGGEGSASRVPHPSLARQGLPRQDSFEISNLKSEILFVRRAFAWRVAAHSGSELDKCSGLDRALRP